MVAKAAKENEEVVEPVEEVEEIPVEPEAGVPAPGVKRQLGVKEPIIFKWKILGASEGVILTLFKSVEREEADAQLERLGKEGYYKELRIVDVNEKVVQPKPPPPKPAGAKPPAPPKLSKAAVKAAAKSAATKAAAAAKQNEPIRVPALKKTEAPAKKGGGKDSKGKDTAKKKSKADSKSEPKSDPKKAKKSAAPAATKKKKR